MEGKTQLSVPFCIGALLIGYKINSRTDRTSSADLTNLSRIKTSEGWSIYNLEYYRMFFHNFINLKRE